MSAHKPIVAKPTKFERSAGSNDASITFALASGDSLTLTLPPPAQAQLLTMLLASAKGRRVGNDFELTRPPIRAHGFASFVQSDDLAGLEVAVQPGAAVHFCFDLPAFRQLAAAVNELGSPRKGAPKGESKH